MRDRRKTAASAVASVSRIACGAVLAIGIGAFSYGQTLTLPDVIRRVCAASDSVKMMKQSLVKSHQVVREKYAAAMPVVTASVAAGRSYGINVLGGDISQGSLPAMPDSAVVRWGALMPLLGQMTSGLSDQFKPTVYPTYSASVAVQQPIYTFGKVGTAVKVAKQYEQSVRSSIVRNTQALQLLAIDAYYGTVLARKAAAVALRSLERSTELYELLKRNFEMGAGSKAMVLAMLAALKSQSTAALTAQQAAVTARMQLNALMDRPLDDTTALDTVEQLPALVAMQLPGDSSAVAAALAERGDLDALRHMAQANRGGAKIFRAMYLPTIGASASAGILGTEVKDLFDWDRRTWTVGVGLNWTLFDGLANNALSRQYRSDAEKLEAALAAVEKRVRIEVADALAGCAVADGNLVASREALEAARESYALLEADFKQGSGQLAELQLADERLRQAQMGELNAQYQQVRSRAALLAAMGRDIVSPEGT